MSDMMIAAEHTPAPAADIQNMKRQELMAACAARFAGQLPPGNVWISYSVTNDEMRDALATGKLPERITAGAPAAPAPADNDKASALLAALQGIIADTTPAAAPIDAEQVKAIVAEQVAAALKDHTRTIEIKLPGKAPQPAGLCHKAYPVILQHIAAADHVYLVGPAGTGKTHMAEAAARALELDFAAISCGPTTSKIDLLGYRNATGDYVSTEFRRLFEHGGVFCFDEIDNAAPEVITQLNAALANGYMLFADGMVKRHPEFRCVACANTYGTGATREFVTRTELDMATLDRFSQIFVGHDPKLEIALTVGAVPAKYADMARAWSALVATIREHDADNVMTGATMRSMIAGAKLLAAGLDINHVLQARVWRGAPEMAVKRFLGIDDIKAGIAAINTHIAQINNKEVAA